MDKKIKQLKDLRILRECALNYDYIPNEDEAVELVEYMLPNYINITVEELKPLLNKYEGYSVGDLESKIIDAIDEL